MKLIQYIRKRHSRTVIFSVKWVKPSWSSIQQMIFHKIPEKKPESCWLTTSYKTSCRQLQKKKSLRINRKAKVIALVGIWGLWRFWILRKRQKLQLEGPETKLSENIMKEQVKPTISYWGKQTWIPRYAEVNIKFAALKKTFGWKNKWNNYPTKSPRRKIRSRLRPRSKNSS